MEVGLRGRADPVMRASVRDVVAVESAEKWGGLYEPLLRVVLVDGRVIEMALVRSGIADLVGVSARYLDGFERSINDTSS